MKISTSLSLYFCCLTGVLVAAELPYEAKKLKVQRDKAVTKIDVKYRSELIKLKAKYTKMGKLDEANAIVEVINSIEVVDTFRTDPELIKIAGKWVKPDGGGFFLFESSGKGRWFPNGRNPIDCTISYDRGLKKYIVKTFRFTTKMSITNSPDVLVEERKNGDIAFRREK